MSWLLNKFASPAPKEMGSSYISGKLPTYPSPMPTLTLTSHSGQIVGLIRGGVGGKFPRNVYNDSWNVWRTMHRIQVYMWILGLKEQNAKSMLTSIRGARFPWCSTMWLNVIKARRAKASFIAHTVRTGSSAPSANATKQKKSILISFPLCLKSKKIMKTKT